MKATMAFSGLDLDILEITKHHFHVLYWSKKSPAHPDADLTSQWEECQKVWASGFTIVTMVLSVFAFSVILCRSLNVCP